VSDYIVRLVDATRSHPEVYLGASPRGSLALYKAGQAFAALQGRDYVIPDDVKTVAGPALAHRIIVKTAATMRDVEPLQIVEELLDSVPVESPRAAAPVNRPRAVERQA
jgi:MoxR-like ATPase